MRLLPLCLLAALLLIGSARADEPFFKKDDVIALVGGEDMVVASECGYLEALITRALPDYHLRFRSLAWEGDTVYEQHRDLNFPSWEEQLDQIGATVVICQFGQMESLAGKEKLPEFIAAYEKLLERFSAGGRRRIVVLGPTLIESATSVPTTMQHVLLRAMEDEYSVHVTLSDFAKKGGYRFADLLKFVATLRMLGLDGKTGKWSPPKELVLTRDGIHLSEDSQRFAAAGFCQELGLPLTPEAFNAETVSAIRAKNKLWFDYWRVQNWAFLAGDRTNQPSSRDHRDPSKRWFPTEREEFIPLIEAKEKEIDALAAKLAGK